MFSTDLQVPKLKQGVTVNFRSRWGRAEDAEVAPYCAMKWAIEGRTQSLAQELPASMASPVLNPGSINTDMLRGRCGGSAANYPSAEE